MKAKEAIANPLPPGYMDIKTAPVEQEVACRTASNLELIGPNGVFSEVKKSIIDNDFFGFVIKVVLFDLKVNTQRNIRLDPDNKPQGCNKDGIIYLAASAVNILAVAPPVYLKDASGKVTNVQLFYTRKDDNQPSTLGIRAKFEENVTQNNQFNPKKKVGTISQP